MTLTAQIASSLIGNTLRTVEKREYDWAFTFADGVALGVPCLWRIIDGGRMVLCSNDHGQQFGLPAPLDGAEESMKFLAGKTISTLTVRPETGDLTMTFAGGTSLEVLSDSNGYEGWRFSGVNGLQAVVVGGGELACWSDKT